MIDPVERFLLTLFPLALVLTIEHLMMNIRYRKASSLQRLAIDVRSGKYLDIIYSGVASFPWARLRTLVMALTIPGVLLIGLGKLRAYFDWQGLLVDYQFTNHFLALLVWLFVMDFGNFAAHWMMHRIPFFWRFHKLHHALEEFNILAGARVSFGEQAINLLMSFSLLALLFGIPNPKDVVYLLVIRSVIDMLQHSDLPWDYGFLGNVIVGPRFHRIHHSSALDDRDANYGNIFSFWDRLFGTAAKRYLQRASVADDVVLGLDSVTETKRYNRLSVALLHETYLEYGWHWYFKKKHCSEVESTKAP